MQLGENRIKSGGGIGASQLAAAYHSEVNLSPPALLGVVMENLPHRRFTTST